MGRTSLFRIFKYTILYLYTILYQNSEIPHIGLHILGFSLFTTQAVLPCTQYTNMSEMVGLAVIYFIVGSDGSWMQFNEH